jgi:hypothetical protein
MMTYYDVLAIAPDATPEQIKQAYRAAVQVTHPDRLQQVSAAARAYAEEQLKRINEAYGVLSNPERRAAYDAAQHAAGTMYEAPRSNPRPAAQTTATHTQHPAAQPAESRGSPGNRADTTEPSIGERHAHAWARLLQQQGRRRVRFWITSLVTGVSLGVALAVVLVTVLRGGLPAPQNVPTPAWLILLGMVSQLIAVSVVAGMSNLAASPSILIRFSVAALVLTISAWLVVSVVAGVLLLVWATSAALVSLILLPLGTHLLLCGWRVRRALARLEVAEQLRFVIGMPL